MVIFFMLLLPLGAISQARRAQSLIARQKFDDAYELLHKVLQKDSLAPAEKYVLSGLFNNPAFEGNDLDSAYYFILAAIHAYEASSEKAQKAQTGKGFTMETYAERKQKIEKEGFERAVLLGKEEDFINFLDEFNTSIYIDSAITLRNSLAFSYATQNDTYEAYKHFFITYPDAKEVPKARKRYEKLLYQHKTADGKLKSYQQFLTKYPDTWHRQEAEQIIFNIITGPYTSEAFQRFLNQYPKSYLAQKAILCEYSLLNANQQSEYLLKSTLNSRLKDSITSLLPKVNILTIPTIHEQQYQLINALGEALVGNLANVSAGVKCRDTSPGLFLAINGDTSSILDLNGMVLSEGNIGDFRSFSNGFVKVETDEGEYFIHHGGFRLNVHTFDKATMAGPYIAFKEKNKWGLESVTGISLLAPRYDTIYAFHHYLVVNDGDKWGIHPMEYYYPLLDGNPVTIDLAYDQISVASNDYLLVMVEDKSALMNRNGDFTVPLANQSIELVDGGYFIDRTDSVLDSRVSKNWYLDISSNKNWTIGDRGRMADIFYKGKPLFIANDAKLIGNTVIQVISGDSTFCYFNDSTKIYLPKDDFIQPIRRMGENSTERHFIYSGNKKQRVLNNKGIQVQVGKFDRLFDLGENYMLRRIKGSSDLLTADGKVAMKDIDAATSLGNGYISFLKDGKFGLFNDEDTTLIKPKYDRPLTPYTNQWFVATTNNKYGLIDRSDSVFVPLIYNEIESLNDSIAVLSNNFRWVFWDVNHGKPLLDNVSDYWEFETANGPVYKIFKGIGYGIWSPTAGLLLNPTFGEIAVRTKGDETVFIAEKWVEEADLVVMLYYDLRGSLLRKEILSTAEYKDLACKEK